MDPGSSPFPATDDVKLRDSVVSATDQRLVLDRLQLQADDLEVLLKLSDPQGRPRPFFWDALLICLFFMLAVFADGMTSAIRQQIHKLRTKHLVGGSAPEVEAFDIADRPTEEDVV